ncbi:MAG: cell division protein FtsZ [Campylobacterota bacterium]|nr:cell division protein FtsZ [Campylobacterota bacterium]
MKSKQEEFVFDNTSIQIVKNPEIGDNLAKITLIGIGGGGCNMIDNYCEKNNYKIKIISANTDNQVLAKTNAPIKIQLGVKTTKGLGAGMNPKVGEAAAEESYNEIIKQLMDSDMVFLCAGLGGGTGSGAIPVIAKAAQELGILCISIVTMPFDFEIGRDVIAENALKKLKQYVDSYIVIYNDRILDIVPQHTGMEESFRIIDNVLFDTVHSISEMILHYQRKNMNVDFADISTTLTKKGQALIGIGNKSGEDAGINALQEAIHSPLLNIESIVRAKSILIHIKSNPNYPIHETKKLMSNIKTNADLGAKCIVGTVWDNDMSEDEVKITLIATGFDIENEAKENIILKKEVLTTSESKKEESIVSRINKWFAKYI